MIGNAPRRPSSLAAGILVAGLIATSIAAVAVNASADAEAEAWLAERAEVVGLAIESTVRDLADGLEAVGAFVEVTPDLTQEKFEVFVRKLDPRLSLIGVSLVPRVPAMQLASFEADMRERYPEFTMKELDIEGEDWRELGIRDTYWPVQYFVGGEFLAAAFTEYEGDSIESVLGFDAGTNDEWKSSLTQSLETETTVTSDFITVGFGNETIYGKAFVLAAPAPNPADPKLLPAVVAAPMIDVILPTELDVSIAEEVTWEIESTDEILPEPEAGAWLDGTIDLPGTSWRLRVQPTAAGVEAIAGTPWWAVWAIGVVASMAAAVLAQLLRQRSRSRAQLADLERMSGEKDRFLASVSHEIRTPLTAVSGLAHELRDRQKEFEEEETHALLTMIAEQSDEVSAIVEDLLVAARSDIGNVTVHLSEVRPYEEALKALSTTGAWAELTDTGPPPVKADAHRVRQILRNLISNAGKYGGDKIQIRFNVGREHVAIEVADSGQPIPESQQERIFAPYTSAHTNNGNVQSIGLGLFISRKLAGLMNGNLSYHHDGTWSVFSLRLPRLEQAG